MMTIWLCVSLWNLVVWVTDSSFSYIRGKNCPFRAYSRNLLLVPFFGDVDCSPEEPLSMHIMGKQKHYLVTINYDVTWIFSIALL